MKTRLLLMLLLCICLNNARAQQTYSIKGSVSDTLNNIKLQYASVTLLRASDSVLIDYTRANANGEFMLHADTAGKYMTMITFPGLADYVDIVNVTAPGITSLGDIPMVSKTHLLQEFVLKQQVAAIKIKGDTTEYVADSFKVREGASVEELLKKLPGIQVNKNGEVVAQGEKVEKILVDGEEFFSDDPAVVTKGLQAKTIDKVQVFDKKSDQAAFTGIDDGQKTKTINLQMKDNMKKGYFGKLVAGGGTDQYFENQGMINAFRKKSQFSAFGIVSNTDKIGLGWQDRGKYSGNDGSTTMSDDGGIMTTYYTSDADDEFSSWDGTYNGQGLPKVWTGGIHYSDKWGDEDKYHISGNYRYAKQNLETTGDDITQYTLQGFQNVSTSHNDKFSTGQRHGADGLFEWKMDSTSSLKLTVNAGYRETKSSTQYHGSIYNLVADSATGANITDSLNNNNRTLNSDASTKNFDAYLLYRKKFKKKGRTMSFAFNENYKESNSDGYLKSFTHFYTTNTDSVIDQHKINSSRNLTLNGRLTYTEPLSKTTFLELNYAFSANNSSAEKNSYDRLTGGEYTDSANQLYSSNYRYNITQNSGGAKMRFVYKKMNFFFGGDYNNTVYNQKNLATDTVYHRSYNTTYNNFFPDAGFTYKIAKQTNLSFNYDGSTRQPTIDQIQPLRDNTNPLNVPVGNPSLRQEFRNSFQLRFNDYKVLSGRYLWSSLSYNSVNNAISRSDVINEDGSRTYQYVNVNGNHNVWGYLGYGFRLKKLNLDLGGNINASLGHSNNFVNGQPNTNNNNSYSLGLDVRYDKENKISISFSPGITYNDNKATISTISTSYWSSNNNLDITYQLPKKFELGTTAEWMIRQRTEVFTTNNNVLRWNAYVSKKMLKKDQLEVRASVFDILNQNVGFSRNAQNNSVSQSSYNTIRRYGLLSVIWNFSHTPIAAPQDNQTMIIK
ncbi:TonB-dependent receptor [Chitinophagaceae bacterium MMS25-I14]